MENIVSAKEVQRLIELEKIIEIYPNGYRLSFGNGKPKHTLTLVSTEADGKDRFVISIIRSEKNTLKVNFHHFYKNTGQFLLRIDLDGTHMNPREINDKVPEKFHPYKEILLKGPHVHYYVEGYDSRWALPFEDTEFKDFSCIEDIEGALPRIVNIIAEMINLKTPIIYDPVLSL